MIRAALYARYSSDRQNELSVADQLVLLSRHAAAKGWVVVASFSDQAISGELMVNRPGVLAAVAAGERREFDLLLAEDEDRIARSLEHLAHIKNRLAYAEVAIATLAVDQVTDMHVAFKGLMSSDFLRNLRQKTRRGMQMAAERGQATGSRLYGYRSQPGGALAIVPEEAEVVREIAQRYAAGETPRAIAADLNVRRVPGPRGGAWNASTINGSRQRANGVLNTELYAGVKVYNRMDVRKDPATGRRRPIIRPESEWKRTEVPQLRIVEAAVWTAVRARKAEGEGRQPQTQRKALKGLFSGLLKCACGASYSSTHGGRLACSGRRERGDCDNRRTVDRAYIEQRVLRGLRERLLAPDVVAAYVRAYRDRMAALRASAEDRRRPMEKRAAELHRTIERLVDRICDGSDTPASNARLRELEAEKAEIEALLAGMAAEEATRPVELHPNAPAAYRQKIAALQALLHEAAVDPLASAAQLVEEVRGLVVKIEIIPRGPERAAPIDVILHGDLARFLEPGPEQSPNECRGTVVAGGRYSRSPPLAPVVLRLCA